MARNRLFGLIEGSLKFSKLLVEEASLDRHDPMVRDTIGTLLGQIETMEEELRQLANSDRFIFDTVNKPYREITFCPPDIAVPLPISVFVRRYGDMGFVGLSTGLIGSDYGLTESQAALLTCDLRRLFGNRKIVIFNFPPILGGDRLDLMKTGDFFICQDL